MVRFVSVLPVVVSTTTVDSVGGVSVDSVCFGDVEDGGCAVVVETYDVVVGTVVVMVCR